MTCVAAVLACNVGRRQHVYDDILELVPDLEQDLEEWSIDGNLLQQLAAESQIVWTRPQTCSRPIPEA